MDAVDSEHSEREKHHAWRVVLAVLAAGWAARGVYLLFRPDVAVSDDAQHWFVVAGLMLQGENPYERTSYLNWPPVWPVCLWLIAKCCVATGASFTALLWSLLIAVESVAIVLLLRLFKSFGRSGWKPVLVGVALNPALVFQVTQHGNFDVLMMVWVLLAVHQFARFQSTCRETDWLRGCAWLGLGVLTKTVPLALLPVAALGARRLDARTIIQGGLLVLVPALVGVGIIFLMAPGGVWNNVIYYRSFGGWYGITGLLHLAGAGWRQQETYATAFSIVLFIWQIGGCVHFAKRGHVEPRTVVLLSGIVMLAIPTVGSGYGPQYIWWYWPTLLLTFSLFPKLWWRILLSVAATVVVATYTVEYVTFPSHGGWLYPELGHASSSQSVQTLIRLPLFVVSALVLAGGIVLIKHLSHGDTPSARAAIDKA